MSDFQLRYSYSDALLTEMSATVAASRIILQKDPGADLIVLLLLLLLLLQKLDEGQHLLQEEIQSRNKVCVCGGGGYKREKLHELC